MGRTRTKKTSGESGPQDVQVIRQGQSLYNPSFIESFKYKQFARNWVLTNGNVQKSWELTFGNDPRPIQEIFADANSILSAPEVSMEIEKIMPTSQQIAEVFQKALDAPTPVQIGWRDKHAYAETIMKLRKQLGSEQPQALNQNIVMVIER